MKMEEGLFLGLAIVMIIAVVTILLSGVKIVQPYEQAIYMRLGKYVRVLNQGLNFVCPLINQVVKLDLRTEVLDVPKQEVITKDNSPVAVDAVIYIKVTDPKNAFFEVTDYRLATVNLAQTTLRSIIGEMELDQILSSRERINVSLRDILDENTDKWGVKIEAVEIREVDPARKVKDSMEEQTSAERKRRAAILEADGLKRAAILEAEGKKKSMILEAEGKRQSTILEAEGKRLAIILEGQGDAQKLRILSVGAASMDSKALSVLSMQTLQEIGKGESSKIFFPMELTRLDIRLHGYRRQGAGQTGIGHGRSGEDDRLRRRHPRADPHGCRDPEGDRQGRPPGPRGHEGGRRGHPRRFEGLRQTGGYAPHFPFLPGRSDGADTEKLHCSERSGMFEHFRMIRTIDADEHEKSCRTALNWTKNDRSPSSDCSNNRRYRSIRTDYYSKTAWLCSDKWNRSDSDRARSASHDRNSSSRYASRDLVSTMRSRGITAPHSSSESSE